LFAYLKKVYFKEASDANHPTLMILASYYKIVQLYNFGFYDDAETLFAGLSDVGMQAYSNSFGVLMLYFYASLVHYQQYRTSGKSRNLKMARKWQNVLERIQSRGCPNAVANVAILRAENISVRMTESVDMVLATYGHAISVIALEKRPHLEAIANERAANFLVHQGMMPEAKLFFDRAIQLYRDDWGSPTMSDFVEEKCAKFMQRAAENPQTFSPHLVGEHISF